MVGAGDVIWEDKHSAASSEGMDDAGREVGEITVALTGSNTTVVASS